MELVDYVVAVQKVEGVLHQLCLVVVSPEYFHLFLVNRELFPRSHDLVQE